ncbi:hypothetical protein B0J14DRAFT_566578 [Halenospora varia]|nr:hypothetical protein B0J14DRAFT_566578 [Halenospora varia]
MSGIFFDETVHGYNPTILAYMMKITIFARNTLGNGNRIIVYNPSMVVPPQWYTLVYWVVAFENNYSAWSSAVVGWIGTGQLSKSLVMMYGFGGTAVQQKSLVNSVVGNFPYITSSFLI